MDFRTLQSSADGYQLDSIKLRGGMGEQESARLFAEGGYDVSWPAGGKTEFGASNNPGWDLAVDGHEVNVKIVADASAAAADHFAKYPDVPLVINEDAANIPDHALSFDPQTAIFPEDLVSENLIIVQEGLRLSGIEAMQAAAEGAAEPSELGDAGDAVPGLGILIAAARSGTREGRLLAHGKTDASRAVKNIAIDTTARGGGGFAGAQAGAQAGLAIDAACGGATLGVPTLVLGLVGMFGGGWLGGKASSSVKLAPLNQARQSLEHKMARYEEAVQRHHVEATSVLQGWFALEEARHLATAHAVRCAYHDLLTECAERTAAVALISPEDIQSLTESCTREVEDKLVAYRALVHRIGLRWRLGRALRNYENSVTEWKASLAHLSERHTTPALPSSDLMDALMATAHGREATSRYLRRLLETRAESRATAVAGNKMMVRLVAESRRQGVATLHASTEVVRKERVEALRPLLSDVDRGNRRMRRELEMAGQ